jgi:hypothetical protein
VAKHVDYAAKYGNANINDLYKLEDEYEKSAAISGWVEAGNDMDDNTVLIKTSDGKEFKTLYRINGKIVTVSASGRRVRRVHATGLLHLYGETGEYRNTDQLTSYSPVAWARFKNGTEKDVAAALEAEMQADGRWGKDGPNFVKQYLYVVQENDDEAVEEAENVG